MMWTNGTDDRWYTDAELRDMLFRELRTNAAVADALGEWVNDEFTVWDAFEWAVLSHVKGEDPLRAMYNLWMGVLFETDRAAIERLFGYDEWEGER